MLVCCVHTSNGNPFMPGNLGWYPQELDVVNYVRGSMLPKPQSQQPAGTLLSLDPSQFTFLNVGKNNDVLSMAMDRYYNITFPDIHKKYDKGYKLITNLLITVEKDHTAQTISTNETCELYYIAKYVRE